MTTPIIYILVPFLVSIILYLIHKQTKILFYVGISLCALLVFFAIFQDFGAIWKVGSVSLEIRSSMVILGRTFAITNQDKFFLIFVYTCTAIWFGATRVVKVNSRFIPLVLAIVSILTSALAVEPFLYSAILVEIAVLVSIPLMLQPRNAIGKGVVRFLVFQSIAMPLILFGGWLLGGIQASLSDPVRQLQSVMFLGVGFAFWLAIVPFQSWVPQLAKEIDPLVSGIILGLFPVVTMLIMLDFISGLVWLRESPFLQPVLRLVGSIMVVSTGIWALTEKDGRRLLGYSVLLESGFAVLEVSLQSEIGVLTLFLSFIPRMGALALMALSLAVFLRNGVTPDQENLVGLIRRFPFASIGFIVALLSVAGIPLFAGFPTRLAVISQLANVDPQSAVWSIIGIIAFVFSIIRFLRSLSKPVFEDWTRAETLGQVGLITIGLFVILLFGVLPNLFGEQIATLLMNLPILR